MRLVAPTTAYCGLAGDEFLIATEPFAALVDYMREYRDCSDFYSEVQKFDVYDDMQRHIDGLNALGVSLRYAVRKVRLEFNSDDVDAKPFDTSVLYVVAFPVGKESSEFATPRSIGMGR